MSCDIMSEIMSCDIMSEISKYKVVKYAKKLTNKTSTTNKQINKTKTRLGP